MFIDDIVCHVQISSYRVSKVREVTLVLIKQDTGLGFREKNLFVVVLLEYLFNDRYLIPERGNPCTHPKLITVLNQFRL